MKIFGLLTTAAFFAFAGAASAECSWGKSYGQETTAEANITPIPEPTPEDVAETPLILPSDTEETTEG